MDDRDVLNIFAILQCKKNPLPLEGSMFYARLNISEHNFEYFSTFSFFASFVDILGWDMLDISRREHAAYSGHYSRIGKCT